MDATSQINAQNSAEDTYSESIGDLHTPKKPPDNSQPTIQEKQIPINLAETGTSAVADTQNGN